MSWETDWAGSTPQGGSGRLGATLAALALGAMALACAKPEARVAPEPAPLAVPVVPPRVLAPAPPAETPQTEPPPAEEPPAATPAKPQARRTGPPPRPEGLPSETRPAVESPPGAAPPPAPVPLLRTPQTADDGEAEKRVRGMLERAEKDLAQVRTAELTGDARAQFDTARRFIGQAQDALTAKNYVFATYLADKAETLSRALRAGQR